MIDLGKPKILKGQMAQAIDGIVRGEFSGSNLLEQLTDGFGVQENLDFIMLEPKPVRKWQLLASGSFLSLSWEEPVIPSRWNNSRREIIQSLCSFFKPSGAS